MQNSQQKGTVKMVEKIASINQVVNGFIWGVPAMIYIIGVGLLLSVRTRFIQIRKFGVAMKNTVGKIFDKTQAKDGSISPFQAVCTALAGTVGTGNIAGVAGAIALGGPARRASGKRKRILTKLRPHCPLHGRRSWRARCPRDVRCRWQR